MALSTFTPTPDQVRAALRELLGWPELVRSPQLSKFLNHIVEAKLRGEEANIKAYSIAVDVFGRPSSFDPQSDPIVRVQARRLRGLLQEYYRQNLARSGTRITLPVGRYVPEFEVNRTGEAVASGFDDTETAVAGETATGETPRRARLGRHLWIQALAALTLVLGLGLLIAGLQIFRDPPVAPAEPSLPQMPTIFLAAINGPEGNTALASLATLLGDELSTLLTQYEDVKVDFVQPGKALPKTDGAMLLSGNLNPAGSNVELTFLLTDPVTGAAIWSETYREPAPSSSGSVVAATVARKIMRQIGAFRGPIHTTGRAWLDEHTPTLPAVSDYICLLSYRVAREALNPAAIARGIGCYDRLLQQQPQQSAALAAKAWLDGRAVFMNAQPGDRLDVAIEGPAAMAQRALELAPGSSFAHEQLATIQTWQGELTLAQRNFAIALGLEPLNTDARASYAAALARLGEWTEAKRQARAAIADTGYPSPWYYLLPSILSFRDGNMEAAIADARRAGDAGELGVLLEVAAAGFAGDLETSAQLRSAVMTSESFRRFGILPWMSLRIENQELVKRLGEGLRLGGIPESALTGQF